MDGERWHGGHVGGGGHGERWSGCWEGRRGLGEGREAGCRRGRESEENVRRARSEGVGEKKRKEETTRKGRRERGGANEDGRKDPSDPSFCGGGVGVALS